MNPDLTHIPSHPASASIAAQRTTMMPELNLLLSDREGAVVRILGLVERRGFRLGAISTHPTSQGTRLSLTLASDDRPADVLLRQIARLQDVLEAALNVQRQPHASGVVR